MYANLIEFSKGVKVPDDQVLSLDYSIFSKILQFANNSMIQQSNEMPIFAFFIKLNRKTRRNLSDSRHISRVKLKQLTAGSTVLCNLRENLESAGKRFLL